MGTARVRVMFYASYTYGISGGESLEKGCLGTLGTMIYTWIMKVLDKSIVRSSDRRAESTVPQRDCRVIPDI